MRPELRRAPVACACAALLISVAAGCAAAHPERGKAPEPDAVPSGGTSGPHEAGEPAVPLVGGAGGSSAPAPQEVDSSVSPLPEPPSAFGPIPIDPIVVRELEALDEPDFDLPPAEIAEQRCGQIFTIQEQTSAEVSGKSPAGLVEVTATVDVARVFDAQGRLVLSEETRKGDVELVGLEPHLRTHLEYDGQGRILRLRQGSFTDPLSLLWAGTVVHFSHADDGSFSATLASTEVVPDRRQIAMLGSVGFCERMEFDAQGRVMEEHWGCDDPELARSYEYDEQGRLERVSGAPLEPIEIWDPRFSEAPSWQIEWDYLTPGQTMVRWNEIDHRESPPSEVTQTLVRHFDESGRIQREELDYASDGTIDERFEYEYPDSDSAAYSRKSYDYAGDGLPDVVLSRSFDDGREILERRHQAHPEDVPMFNIMTFWHFEERLGRHSAQPQSLARWTIESDDDGRSLQGDLVIREVNHLAREEHYGASQQQTTHADGYVEHVLVEVESDADETRGGRRETSCRLEPACDDGPPLALPDAALLACQTGAALQGPAQPLAVREHSAALPLPFALLPGLRERNERASRFRPAPASVRELVGY